MQDDTEPNEAPKTSDAPLAGGVQPRGARLRKRHWAGAVLTGLGGLALALAVGFVLLIGRDLRAPDWLQAEIETRLAQAVPELDVGIGAISLRIEQSDLSPRVFLQNVTVRDETGLPFASLSELSVRASFAAALGGKFLPKKISLTGALVKLRRASDGSFDLTVGSALQSSGGAPSLVELIENIDILLVRPELERLTDLQADALTVLYEDARAGRAWTVDGGRVRLTRDGDDLALGADFALLGGQDYATTLELSYDSAIGSRAARIGLSLADAPSQDIASQTPALAWMQGLRAPISGSMRTEVDAAGKLGSLNATLQFGAGVVQPEDEAQPIPFEGAQTYFSYDPAQGVLNFSQVSVESAWVNAAAEGRARLVGAANGGWPTALVAQLRFSNVSANPWGLYPEPVTLQSVVADVRVRFDPFEVHLGQLALQEAGQVIIANGRADIAEEGWRVALDASAEKLVVGEVLKVWPASLKTNTRDWIENNVLEAQITDARFALRAQPGTRPDLHLNFKFDDAAVRYMKTLPPMTDASGLASLSDGRFLAFAERGRVTAPQGGALRIDGTSFEIPDTRIKNGPARVNLVVDGTVTAALSILDQEPFEFLSKAGQPVTLADGRAAVSGDIDFALKRPLPPGEISFDLAGTLSAVRSTALVPGRVLAADQLAVSATTTALKISGAGRIDAVPFEGQWAMGLGRSGNQTGGQAAAGSQITGQIELSERFTDTFNIGLPPGSVSGTGQGEIAVTLKRGAPPEFALTSNLRGVGLRIAAIGWQKAASAAGALAVQGSFGTAGGARTSVDRISLDAPGLVAQGRVSITPSGTLDRAEFSRVQVGDWLDAPVTLTGRGAGASPAVALNGGTVDLRRLPQSTGGGGGSGAAVPLSIALDRLTVTKTIALTAFRGEFTQSGGLTGQFAGSLNGRAPVQGQTEARGGRTALRITAQNAGRAISASGLLKNADQGTLVLDLAPRDRPGTYDGRLLVENLRLLEPPQALALLSAASGIGLLEQLDGQGLMFNEVDSRFRITPETIIISEGSAVGPSIGLSVDGYYNVANAQVDLQGVVSPLYALNAIGAIFTRKGEGLVGFNYTLQGAAAAPTVRVNPLSLFTPGMFREIFRRPPPDLSQ